MPSATGLNVEQKPVSASFPAQITNPPISTLEWLAIVSVTICGAAMRLHLIGTRSLWFDEGLSGGMALMPWRDFGQLCSAETANYALYYLLMKLWVPLGHSDAWTRGLSFLLGVAGIPAIYWLGRRMFGPWVGVSAALLLALNAFHIHYSQEARVYSLVALLVILSTGLLLRAVELDTRRAWFLWALVSALAVWAHFHDVFILAAQGVWFLCFAGRRRWSNAFYGARWLFYFLVPYVIFMLRGGPGLIRWVLPLSLDRFLALAKEVTGNAEYWMPVLLTVACIGIVFDRRKDENPKIALMALLALLPFALVIAISIWKPILFPRYMMGTLPALLLLASATAMRFPRALAALWMSAAVAASGWGTYTYFARDYGSPDDWRNASAYVRAHVAPRDYVVFYTWQGALPYHYYAWLADRAAPPPHAELLKYRDIVGIIDDLPKQDPERVWLVFDHFGGNDPGDVFVRGWFSRKYKTTQEVEFTGMTIVRLDLKKDN